MAMKSLSIHGHFYQPPRQDPFTGVIPNELGAEPFNNWNERIFKECYFPNTQSGNFERISFNIGPTLYEWLHKHYPDTTASIVRQDFNNRKKFEVGNAIAQSFHHTILPLSNRQDKMTQIYWGKTQFAHRFGREPKGMWLPETAVDLETLEVLNENGFEFTILAPWQADQEDIDCTEAYDVELGFQKKISVFFYQKDLSGGISFNPDLTTNADLFLRERVLQVFSRKKELRGENHIVLIATDGELYGHHQQFRDKFLSHLVNGASHNLGITPTYPALWMETNPPRSTVRLRESTSWSCHHGVQRWQGDCGCIQTNGSWKFYLRQACDNLASELDALYHEEIKEVGINPWELRNQYIHVLLNTIRVDEFIRQMAGRTLESGRFTKVRYLLEAQYQRQRMFSSCGWFFDDFDRIEPKNCLGYAAQSIMLARYATGVDLSSTMTKALSQVVSHKTGLRGDKVLEYMLEKALRLDA